ncbi:MAG: hypothetical protein R3B72_01715 [Polyangiaceae bacterium]
MTPALPDDSSVLAEGGFDDSGLVVGTDHGWRLLLHARDKHAVLCNVAPARREARCAPLPPAIPIADSVLLVDGAPDAPPHVLAREGEIAPERWGLYHAESGELRLAVDHDPVGALLDSRGVAVVVRDGERYVLLGPGQPQLLADDDALGPPLAHGSWLATPIPGALRLRRARFDEAGAVSFEPSITLPFALPEATPRVALEACRAPSLVAIVGHPDPALEPPPVAVALLSEGRWSSHVAEVSDGRYGVACDDGGVSLTSIETVAGDDYRSSETRCTPKGCRVERRAWALDRASRSSRFLVGSLGQTPVVLWRSRLGDVRLAAATEGDPRIMLALEGDDHGGFAWERHGATLFTRGRHGLLLVASERFGSPRNHGFLLSAEGLTPLTVQR